MYNEMKIDVNSTPPSIQEKEKNKLSGPVYNRKCRGISLAKDFVIVLYPLKRDYPLAKFSCRKLESGL
ncbi:hypothetical protein RIF29_12192 [Crotalaria pallida]|uniref:Uncharacterized protein n=1 Tax=Crotalaria pallida TaxID=3830 RepID=A0AAN9IN03_CROPI